MPTVSVIIPTYKHRDFVRATLDSVFAQTFTDYEVIVINDGSPDDTAEVLRPLAEAGRIRYMEQTNTGQSIARNRGIAEAKGEFIALLDDDDLWPPDKLEWQVQAMTLHPETGVIAGPARVVDADLQYLYRSEFSPSLTFEGFFSNNLIMSPGQTLIRASALREVGGLNPDLWGVDDWDLWVRLSKSSAIIMKDQNALIYRLHSGNASKNLCRMLDNCCHAVDLNLADVAKVDRDRLKLIAYRWLYNYLGVSIVLSMKQAVKAGKVSKMLEYAPRLTKLARVLARNPSALSKMARDFLPERFSERAPANQPREAA